MRKLISLLLAVLLVLGTPMTAMAITVDTSYGDATIYDTTADYYDTNGDQHNNAEHGGIVEIMQGSGSENGTVSVEMDGKAEDGNDTPATEPVNIKGDVNGGVVASGGANVIIEGNVSGKDGETNGGDGIQASGSTVKVTGNVTGGNATNNTEDGDICGGDGVNADEGAIVEVGGDVTGGSANAYYAHGGDGVYADKGSKVEVGGSVTGGSAEGSSAGGGDGVYAFEGSEVEVNGSTTGGSADGGYDYANGGNGITMQGDSVIQVAGDAVGGSTTGSASNSEDGFGANIYVKPATPGSLTVKGEVSGGSNSADIYVEEWPIYPAGDKPGMEHVPDISVGNYDSIEFNDYFTEEEARQIVGSIKVTNRPSSSPSDDVTVKRSSGTARNGYYMGCLWRNGYITRTLFKVENGAGMKPIWQETIENGTLTITCENEPVILTTWLEGLKQHQKLGIERIVVKTENCETELVIADLIAMNGTECVLTQKDDTATLTVDGKEAEIG